MRRFMLAVTLIFGLAAPAWADLDSAFDAYFSEDYATAFHEFQPLAEQGNIEAEYWLGTMYEEGLGVSQDKDKALRWYQKAAEQGDFTAKLNISAIALEFLQKGYGFYSSDRQPQDYAEATKWFHKAVKLGEGDAAFYLGVMSLHGQGTPRNFIEAAKWLRIAADRGHLWTSWAQYNLGVLYANGQGVPQDQATAVNWYQKAAEQGSGDAQNSLGGHYQYGRGVARDYVKAHMWYNLAASRLSPGENRDRAAKNRDDLTASMTSTQITEAQRLARAWRPKSRAELAQPSPSIQHDRSETSRESVKSIQANLAALGYDTGPIDGKRGPRTRSAISDFQRDRGMAATGEVSQNLEILLLKERLRSAATNRAAE